MYIWSFFNSHRFGDSDDSEEENGDLATLRMPGVSAEASSQLHWQSKE